MKEIKLEENELEKRLVEIIKKVKGPIDVETLCAIIAFENIIAGFQIQLDAIMEGYFYATAIDPEKLEIDVDNYRLHATDKLKMRLGKKKTFEEYME